MPSAAQILLAQLLAYAALIAATVEYIEIVRRRIARRGQSEQHAVEASGLQGLVRVFISDGQDAAA